MRRDRALLTALIAALAGCGLEGPNEFQPGVRLCEARLTLSGTLAQSAPKPEDVVGCWPVGTWTFGAALEQSDCDDDPSLEDRYEFRVERDEDSVESYTFVNDPAYERLSMKVSSGGSGLCTGSFTIYSADGTEVLTLKPMLNADQSIDGFAEFSRYGDDQWN